LIRVYTFVTDPAAYDEMRASFERAGFTAGHAEFTELRAAGADWPEPYSTITELIATVEEPFFVLCHQDVRLDQGHGIEQLDAAIGELEALDPEWAAAGNAGGSRSLRVVRTITDPHGGGSSGDALPARVHSLDENFLVIRSGTGIGCSPALSGFHLYGTDLCLNALEHGRRPYVIDFHLRHLSPGTRDAAYIAARDRLVAHWSERILARYVRTTVDVLFLSRSRLLSASLGSPTVRRLVKGRAPLGGIAGTLLAPRPGRPR
jgi:hypothetical protein